MAENKTKASDVSFDQFVETWPAERRRGEARALDALFRRVTGCAPKLWGPSIVGYGSYHYRYGSGREGTSLRAGFSPRKAALTLYAMADSADMPEGAALFARLGKHTTGKSCLYIKKLSDVDPAVLERLIELSWEHMNVEYPA